MRLDTGCRPSYKRQLQLAWELKKKKGKRISWKLASAATPWSHGGGVIASTAPEMVRGLLGGSWHVLGQDSSWHTVLKLSPG